MGPYCDFCARRCFVQRVLRDGRTMLLATCARGMEHDRAQAGQDHTTALNPVTEAPEVRRLAAEMAELAEIGAPLMDNLIDEAVHALTMCGDIPAADIPRDRAARLLACWARNDQLTDRQREEILARFPDGQTR